MDTRYDARLVGCDEDVDLAVLKVSGKDLPAAQFGVSDDLMVGDPAYAIGNPLGVELRNTLTSGIISAINRDVDVDGVTMTLIQTTAALNSGHSAPSRRPARSPVRPSNTSSTRRALAPSGRVSGMREIEDGYVLTNCHVIEGCSACTVLITDRYGVDTRYDARLV